MARLCSVIVTLAVTVALCLALSGCRTPTDDPGAGSAQSDPANIEATVSAALRPLEETRPGADGVALRPPAPMFAGTFMDGNDYRLEDTVGTPTLLMFWAPW